MFWEYLIVAAAIIVAAWFVWRNIYSRLTGKSKLCDGCPQYDSCPLLSPDEDKGECAEAMESLKRDIEGDKQ
jgi:hypothetical protein